MAVQARRKSEKEERKSLILSKALTLFKLNGFSGTTIRQIANESNLAPGTIYLYFADKNQIFCELLLEGYDLLIEQLLLRDTKQNVSSLIEHYLSFAQTNPEYFSLIFYIVQSEGQGVLDLTEKESLMFKELDKRKTICLEIVKTQVSEIRPDIGAARLERVAEAAWSMLAGVILFFIKDGKERFDSIANEAKIMLISAIKNL